MNRGATIVSVGLLAAISGGWGWGTKSGVPGFIKGSVLDKEVSTAASELGSLRKVPCPGSSETRDRCKQNHKNCDCYFGNSRNAFTASSTSIFSGDGKVFSVNRVWQDPAGGVRGLPLVSDLLGTDAPTPKYISKNSSSMNGFSVYDGVWFSGDIGAKIQAVCPKTEFNGKYTDRSFRNCYVGQITISHGQDEGRLPASLKKNDLPF